MSSSDIKLPLMPTPALDDPMFSTIQLDEYARCTVDLNKPEACLYYQGIVLARGNWAEMRDLQAIVLKGGMRVEVRATRDLGAYARVTDRGIEVSLSDKSACEMVEQWRKGDGSELYSFWKGATVQRPIAPAEHETRGAEMVGFKWPETGVLDVPADTKMLRLERRGHEPLTVGRADVLAVALGKQVTPEPFDLERAKAGEPIQTRGGLAARFVGFDKDMPEDRQVVVVVAPSILYSHRFADGRYSSAPGPHAYDLVMAPKPKRVVWVNTFKEPTPGGVTSMTFDTEAAAKEHGRRARTCLSAVAERKEI